MSDSSHCKVSPCSPFDLKSGPLERAWEMSPTARRSTPHNQPAPSQGTEERAVLLCVPFAFNWKMQIEQTR